MSFLKLNFREESNLKLKTSIKISITGEQVERFFNLCSHHSINLYNIHKFENNYYASMDPACFFSLKALAKKTNIKIKLVSKEGILFLISNIKKQCFFIVFPFVCFLALLLSSCFLWNVQINGNQSITQDMLRDYLQINGIHYGMLLKEIPLNQLKTDIRNEYPQINWVSIYLEGTTLQIDIKENDSTIYKTKTNNVRKDIIAPESGIIETMLVRTGTPCVSIGEEVKKGDVLIMGMIDIPSENGITKKSIPCSADGDVYLVYKKNINESLPLTYTSKEYTNRKSKNIELNFSNNSYNIPNSNIPFLNYDVLTEEIPISLISILSLPVSIKQNTYYEYYNKESKYSVEECEKIMNQKLEEICKTFIEKGVQIIEKNVKIETNSVYSTMSGSMTLKVNCSSNTLLEDNT